MNKKIDELSIFQFQQQFPDAKACLLYLAKQKWAQRFSCERCKHNRYCRGSKEHARQCTKCRYQASPTSGTLFHKLKFPIVKAFYIIFYMATNKKGITSTELSRKLDLPRKTCLRFQQKVRHAMGSGAVSLLEGSVEVDETVIGGRETGVRGRKNEKKQLLVMGIERKKPGVGRMYVQHVKNGGSKELRKFFKKYIAPSSNIRTDQWRGYVPLKADYSGLQQEKAGYQGSNFKLLHRGIMMLKSYLRGVHHSVKRLQGYLDEYVYRYNNRIQGGALLEDLLGKMVLEQPITYGELLCGTNR